MNISEIKKIVNDGLVKYKAYKEADKALEELETLAQAKNDLAKDVEVLKASIKKLEKELGSVSEISAEATAKADKIIDAASKKAVIIEQAAVDKVNTLEADAKAKLDRISDETEAKRKEHSALSVAIAKAEKENSEILAVLAVTRDSLKNII